jgi:hypothetical protein
MAIFSIKLCQDLLDIHKSIENRLCKLGETSQKPILKQAFDTRRMNQEVQYNPRHNLQLYQRSDPYISQDLSMKIKNLFKVKVAADMLKEQFLENPIWFDSHTRILCNALDTTLRVEQKDYDFSDAKFDYVNELLYLRYRLGSADIDKMSEQEIKIAILNKDEKLLHASLHKNYNIFDKMPKDNNEPKIIQNTHTREIEKSGEELIEKLFGTVKASKDAKNVERTITIKIQDQLHDEEINKQGS